jgi:hypothetical protein
MTKEIIRKENGKEVAYDRTFFGDVSKRELHENLDGSKDTRNVFGTQVHVERQGFLDNEVRGTVDGVEGTFRHGFFDTKDSPREFIPDETKRNTSEDDDSSSSDDYVPSRNDGSSSSTYSHSQSSSVSTPKKHIEREISWHPILKLMAARHPHPYTRLCAAKEMKNPYVFYMMALNDKDNIYEGVYGLCSTLGVQGEPTDDNYFRTTTGLVYKLALERTFESSVNTILIDRGLYWAKPTIPDLENLVSHAVSKEIRLKSKQLMYNRFFSTSFPKPIKFVVSLLDPNKSDHIPRLISAYKGLDPGGFLLDLEDNWKFDSKTLDPNSHFGRIMLALEEGWREDCAKGDPESHLRSIISGDERYVLEL